HIAIRIVEEENRAWPRKFHCLVNSRFTATEAFGGAIHQHKIHRRRLSEGAWIKAIRREKSVREFPGDEWSLQDLKVFVTSTVGFLYNEFGIVIKGSNAWLDADAAALPDEELCGYTRS